MEGPWRQPFAPGVVNGYQYNGKEITEDLGLGWYFYGARMYDPPTCRFTGVDPIADRFAHVSAFNYAENDPVGSIDLHGLQKVKLSERSGAFFIGAINAIGSNLIGSPPGTRMPTNQLGSELSGSVNAGQKIGDAVSVVLGGYETAIGLYAAGAGLLAAPETGGGSLVITGGGIVVAGLGVSTQVTALRNLMSSDETGSYTNKHEKKNYHGKGPKERADQSAKEKAEKYDDPLVEQEWTPAKNDREAFKDESRRLEKDGGHKSSNNYNKRDSPGTKYRKQDGDN